MNKGLIGKKIGMTQIFDESGKVIPVTVIEAGPCVVAQVKTEETDGYTAIQLGFGDIKEKKLTKPAKGHFTKVNVTPKKHLREFRLDSVEGITVGQELKADIFSAGDKLDIQGTSKGKGFQGVIKRQDRKSTRLNSSHVSISYAVFCLKKKKKKKQKTRMQQEDTKSTTL